MYYSKSFIKTTKEVPSDADSINASYFVRAGFITKHMAGAYAFLPLGLKVLKKIETIIREEMNNIGGQELLMNVLQPKELWMKTGRWDEMDDVLYKCADEKNQIALAATHEEQVTWIVKNRISSYKDLPSALFQIQTKFRNEPRAKSGLLRGREFQMKDMYSFHATQEDFEKFYDLSKEAYLKVYERVGLKAKIVEASGGSFTKKNSHEFQVFCPTGEDTIFFCDKCDFAQNKEIAKVTTGDKCPRCGEGKIEEEKSIEVGNIFPLETKYSDQLGAKFVDKDGKEKTMIMGCYGIGISRVMATVAEVNFDSQKNKMIWPKEIAPFKVYLISIGENEKTEEIYKELVEKGVEVLYDDRDVSPGVKFADADLFGAPYRIVVSSKTLAENKVEILKNTESNPQLTNIDKIEIKIEN